jgi:outer membrane protein assembly factor BamB
MTTTQAAERNLRKPLRLWPGVVAVVVLLLARFGVKAAMPGFPGFALGMKWALGAALGVLVWWAFVSRVRWSERLGVLVLMIAGLAGTWFLRHESMGPAWFFAYAVPMLCVALVAGAAASRRLPDRRRRAVMAATILLACGVWTLVRTEGITGDHVIEFDWRWSKSPEERLLAQAGNQPTAIPPAPAAAEVPKEPVAAATGDKPLDPARPSTSLGTKLSSSPLDVARGDPEPVERSKGRGGPAARAADPVAPKSTGERPAMSERGFARVEWPGFRGPERDGVSRGVRIETNWSASPPVELWRRPIGPGWSSFAVRGDFLYTQEQRGDDEVVACYNATTGAPVWTHRDAARFFESNAGAGPRGTPTLSDGHVYTFGATGIVNALDARDGAVLWSRNAASDAGAEVPYWGFSSSPLVVGDVVIVAASGTLVAYELATGKLRWIGQANGGSYSSPHLATIDGVAQVLLMSGSGAISVAPADGKRLWEHPWRGVPIVQPAVTADGDVLIAANADSGTRRLTIAHGPGGWTVEERWTSRGLKPYFNDFVVHEGHAFGFDARILACIDVEDGERKWKGGRYGNGQLVLLPDQDLLLVLSEEGELALVKATPDQFTEIARFKAIEGKTWNHPVLVGDVLLVRNGEEMAAFRLSLASR